MVRILINDSEGIAKNSSRFLKRNPMFSTILASLVRVPFKVHGMILPDFAAGKAERSVALDASETVKTMGGEVRIVAEFRDRRPVLLFDLASCDQVRRTIRQRRRVEK